MKKVKHIASQLQINGEPLARSLPKLEEVDTPETAQTKLEAEEILHLKDSIIHSKTNIQNLETDITKLLELRVALEKLDRNKEEPITVADIDAQIKFCKRQIHIDETRIRKNEDRIQRIITKKVIRSEQYEKDMPDLKSRRNEISREIKLIALALDKFQKAPESFTHGNMLFEPVIRKEAVHDQIQLLERDKVKYGSQLQYIEAKINDLEQEVSQDTFLVSNQVKQLFFNGSTEKNHSIPETELKSFTL